MMRHTFAVLFKGRGVSQGESFSVGDWALYTPSAHGKLSYGDTMIQCIFWYSFTHDGPMFFFFYIYIPSIMTIPTGFSCLASFLRLILQGESASVPSCVLSFPSNEPSEDVDKSNSKIHRPIQGMLWCKPAPYPRTVMYSALYNLNKQIRPLR